LLCFDFFGGGFALFLWWPPHHRFALLLFLNLLLFDLFFGGGVSMPPVVVLMLFGSHTVFRFHACFCFTHVLFLGFWFTRVSVFFTGWSGYIMGSCDGPGYVTGSRILVVIATILRWR
jgi:hypothetical protein